MTQKQTQPRFTWRPVGLECPRKRFRWTSPVTLSRLTSTRPAASSTSRFLMQARCFPPTCSSPPSGRAPDHDFSEENGPHVVHRKLGDELVPARYWKLRWHYWIHLQNAGEARRDGRCPRERNFIL